METTFFPIVNKVMMYMFVILVYIYREISVKQNPKSGVIVSQVVHT